MDCYHTTSQLAFAGQDKIFEAPVYKAVLHSSFPLKISSYSWIWVANSPGMGKHHWCLKSIANLVQTYYSYLMSWVHQKCVLAALLRPDCLKKQKD